MLREHRHTGEFGTHSLSQQGALGAVESGVGLWRTQWLLPRTVDKEVKIFGEVCRGWGSAWIKPQRRGTNSDENDCHNYQFISVMSHSLWPHGLQHARPPCPSPNPRVYSNSCPLNRWCHPTISSSVIPFFSRLQSFPASGSFQMSQLFESGGRSIGVSASTSVLPMSTQNWSPLGWTGLISLQSKGLSRVFSNTAVQKHQFFGAQHSL